MHWRETKARRYETLFSTNDKVFFFYEDGGITRLAVINPDAIAADPEAIKKRVSDCETLLDQVDVVCSEQWTIPADCSLSEHLKAQNEGKVARDRFRELLPTPRPQLVEHNSQDYIVFATRDED